MKKVLLILSIICSLILGGCATNQKNDDENVINNNVSEEKEEKKENTQAVLSYDTEEKPYVKLSDSYYYDNSNYKEVEKKEITPTKIYLVDDNKNVHISRYNEDITIDIPIEKCETSDEERIAYSNYGIEKMLNTGIVRIGGLEIQTNQLEYGASDNESLKERILYDMSIGLQKIYEVELDNKVETKEIMVYSRFDYPWDSYNYPYLISYNGNVAQNIGLVDTEKIVQVGNYSNVFLDGWNSDIEGYFSNVLMGYYVYDSESGLIHVDKMANGENINQVDINKLDSCYLAYDVFFGAISENDNYSGKAKYSTWAYGEDVENIKLEAGTKIKIIEIIDEYGNFIGETEDGIGYCFFNFASR